MNEDSELQPLSSLHGNEESMTEALARRARSGEMDSFNALCERVLPALCGWAQLRVAPALRSRIDPEELVQETWLRALLRFEDYDASRGTFRAWMFGIAKNVLLHALRTAHGSRVSGSGSTSNLLAIEAVADTATSATKLSARSDAVQRFLERALTLSKDEQRLTVFCGLEGLTCREAAERLGIGEEAAKKRWQRLRAEFVARGSAGELLAD
jgi:RNA polymerase sigma-70 factor (ECF subfamily)